MRLKLTLFLLLQLLAARPLFAIEPGQVSPNFELPGIKQAVKLSQYSGKVVYLDFWASWCGPCKKSFPWMSEIQTKFGPQGLQAIAINLDSSRQDAEKFLAAQSSNIEIAFDPEGKLPEVYGVDTMPTSFLINRKGELVAVYRGFHEEDAQKILSDIEAQIKKEQ